VTIHQIVQTTKKKYRDYFDEMSVYIAEQRQRISVESFHELTQWAEQENIKSDPRNLHLRLFAYTTAYEIASKYNLQVSDEPIVLESILSSIEKLLSELESKRVAHLIKIYGHRLIDEEESQDTGPQLFKEEPLLCHFICLNQVSTIFYLLEKREDIRNQLNNHYQHETPLHHAAKVGNVEIIDLLLNAGAELNTYNLSTEKETVLQIAVGHGYKEEIVAYLLKHQNMTADIINYQTERSQYTALHLAIKHGQLTCARLLINKDANLFLKDLIQNMPIAIAIRMSLDDKQPSSLTLHQQYDDFCVELLSLMQQQANEFQQDDLQKQATARWLEDAIQNGLLKTVQWLIKTYISDDNPIKQDFRFINSAVCALLETAAFADKIPQQERYEQILVFLIEQKFNAHGTVSERTNNTTVLHIAAKLGRLKLMGMLHEAGAQSIVNDNGDTPLHFCARETDDRDCANFLMKIAPDSINQKSCFSGETPLHFAVRYGHSAVVGCLLDHPKIEVSVTDNEGNTALHFAAKAECVGHRGITEAHYITIIDALCRQGIDASKKNNAGKSTIDYCPRQYPKILQKLNCARSDVLASGGSDIKGQLLIDVTAEIDSQGDANFLTTKDGKTTIKGKIKTGGNLSVATGDLSEKAQRNLAKGFFKSVQEKSLAWREQTPMQSFVSHSHEGIHINNVRFDGDVALLNISVQREVQIKSRAEINYYNAPPPQKHWFIQRVEFMEKIADSFPEAIQSASEQTFYQTPNRYNILCGAAGEGKTTLVADYFFNTKKPYHFRAWFTAENSQALKAQFLDLACVTGLWQTICAKKKKKPSQDVLRLNPDEQNEVIDAVKRWLTHPENNCRLRVVLDKPNEQTMQSGIAYLYRADQSNWHYLFKTQTASIEAGILNINQPNDGKKISIELEKARKELKRDVSAFSGLQLDNPHLGEITELLTKQHILNQIGYFQHYSHDYCLVFDGAPSYAVLEDFLPSHGGDIIITSQNTFWLGQSKITVAELEQKEAVALVKAILTDEEEAMVTKLVEKVGQHPAQLEEVAKYIKDITTITRYLEELKFQQAQQSCFILTNKAPHSVSNLSLSSSSSI
jgi:ankyrin repeat protein